MKDMKDSDAVKKMSDSLQRELVQKNETIERIQTPNMKVIVIIITKISFMSKNHFFII